MAVRHQAVTNPAYAARHDPEPLAAVGFAANRLNTGEHP